MEKNQTAESGAQDGKDAANAGGDSGKPGIVPYEQFDHAVGQTKKVKEKLQVTEAKLQELLREKEEREKKELEQQGNYKKMLELREKEVLDTKQRLSEIESRWTNSVKLSAVMTKIPGKVEKSQYLGFIDLDKVVIDPETNEVDLASAEAAASEFVKSYPELIKTEGKKLPSNSASGGQTGITESQWKHMTGKEKKKYKITDIKWGE
jgi:predicted nuclease with TOPRIM domain